MADEPIRGMGIFIIENSDGCSALSIPYRHITKLLTKEEKYLPFLNHCIAHDECYWYGGTRKQRLEADLALFAGTSSCGENAFTNFLFIMLASLMFIVTRILGSPLLPTPFRWMYHEKYTSTLKYTVDDVHKNRTVVSNNDATIVQSILESPWFEHITTIEQAIRLFNGKD